MEYRPASLVTPAIALGLGAALMFILQKNLERVEQPAATSSAAYVNNFEWAPLEQPQAPTPVLRMTELRMTENQIAQNPAVQQRWVF